MRYVVLVVCACNQGAQPIARCTDDLAGVYEVETTATEEAPTRWHVLDNRRSLEAYPMFDDTTDTVPGVELAPRVIDLHRTPEELGGEVTRRYMQGSRRCDAKARAQVTACRDDRLEIVLADPVPPINFDPCTWGQAAPSRRERWRRVR